MAVPVDVDVVLPVEVLLPVDVDVVLPVEVLLSVDVEVVLLVEEVPVEVPSVPVVVLDGVLAAVTPATLTGPVVSKNCLFSPKRQPLKKRGETRASEKEILANIILEFIKSPQSNPSTD